MPDIHIDPKVISEVLLDKVENYKADLTFQETGRVLEAGDGIAHVDGLPRVMLEEMVLFPDDIYGMAMSLERNEVGIIILGDYAQVQQGDTVKRTGKVLQVPAGRGLLGRVVNALGQPIDGRGQLSGTKMAYVETDAPGIAEREPVDEPLYTGLKSVDGMTAIGRGQRELVIGDRQTGKTTLAIDTILNQADKGVHCVYVAIGQKMSTVATVVDLLTRNDAMRHTTVVVATASDSAPLQYIAPFTGCTMAEYYRDAGEDALVVYDDLSKHAVAYREISLLLHRPPGREAFPGDIFYLHSRLLERAAKLHPDLGNGSLTALPIIETQQGDYSAYIPTNLVSITDGQIYLQTDLFHQGFRPAMNVGLSVSRVGGKAQSKAMKRVALKLRLELAQYREVASFAQLTTDLDAATTRQLHRGERLAEILKQIQHEPLSMDKQVSIMWAAVNGYLDDIPLCDISRFEKEWFALLDSAFASIRQQIIETQDLGDELCKELHKAIDQFKQLFVRTREAEDISADRIVPSTEDRDLRLANTAMRTS